ncbi:MAG: PAS domain-containing protein [Opitutaceae bacterium]|nr:PAS domain-containing protein [Opitutaceae bacterium]
MTLRLSSPLVRCALLTAGAVIVGAIGLVVVIDLLAAIGRSNTHGQLAINLAGILAAGTLIFLVFWFELTRLRRVEQQLEGRARQLGLVSDTANVGLWEWNLRTDQIVFSRRWRSQLGYDAEEIGNNLAEWDRLIHPEDLPRVHQEFRTHLTAPDGDFESTFRLRHKDGTWRIMLARGGVLRDDQGAPSHMIGVDLDITERQRAAEERLQLQARLLESQKLESLGLLAGSIAHDFNNLLTGVLSNAELAMLDLPPEGVVTARIEQIKQAAVRMADLAREMLAYSGRGAFNVTHVDLNTLVQEMTNLLTMSISKRVELRFALAATPVIVEAEATQIRQVLMNLITNASDAMAGRSGIIRLTTGVVEARSHNFAGVPWADELREGCYAFFEVQDSGCGMDSETLRRMFEPFFTTKPRGRGLGLAAVQGIVRGHHGALHIRSTPGRGTTVRVLLPLAVGAGDVPHLRPEAHAWHGTGTILVVEDDEIVSETASILLARLGFEVLAAPEGYEAIRLSRQAAAPFRAVLLDATISGLDGRELVGQLRALQPAVPVLLISGYSEQEVTALYEGVPVAGFVPKPFAIDCLEQALRRVLPEATADDDQRPADQLEPGPLPV